MTSRPAPARTARRATAEPRTRRKPAATPTEPRTRRKSAATTEPPARRRPAAARAKPGEPAKDAPPPNAAVPATGRHREVLNAAAELIAEHGYGGASLRELARRVGMSQPSLYHYFRTKEDLVLQIIETLAADMQRHAPTTIPTDPTQFPRILANLVRELYDTREHPVYVRAVFAFSRMDPRFGAANRQIFVDSMLAQLRMGLAPFVARGELPEQECVDLLRMVVHAIGFRLMEELVLFDDRPLDADVDRYIDYIVTIAERRVRELWRPTT